MSNLDPEAIADYLQRRKSITNFWYVAQEKRTRAACLNAEKTKHECKLIDKMQNMCTIRSYPDRKLEQEDLFAALKPKPNYLKLSMVKSIDELIEHNENDYPGRFQCQQLRPKNFMNLEEETIPGGKQEALEMRN